jgi:hypothetical protein
MEGFSMSAQILDFTEAKKRREHHQLMKARYGAVLLAESLAEEAADREVRKHDPKRLAHIESYKKSNPNWTPDDLKNVHSILESWGE